MKKELRKKYKTLRRLNNNFDEIICDNLYDLVKDCKNIAVYLSINDEVNLKSLINRLLINNNVYVPFVIKGSKILEFRKLFSLDDLTLDDAKIPTSPLLDTIEVNKLDAVVLSCLACNLDGYRLGYGGGYYDQTLKTYQGIKIGVVYDNCITSLKFQEHYDIILDYLVTEKQVIIVNKE